MDELPFFKYHPDPLGTGTITQSHKECASCRRARGYIYKGPVYSVEDLDDSICPWCIADGSAAEKFDASFTDGQGLSDIPEERLEQVTQRTPGYNSWQPENWKAHCGDACAFLGDVSKEDMGNIDSEARSWLSSEMDLDSDEWDKFLEDYEVGGDPAVYKFSCLHCGAVLYDWDCS